LNFRIQQPGESVGCLRKKGNRYLSFLAGRGAVLNPSWISVQSYVKSGLSIAGTGRRHRIPMAAGFGRAFSQSIFESD